MRSDQVYEALLVFCCLVYLTIKNLSFVTLLNVLKIGF